MPNCVILMRQGFQLEYIINGGNVTNPSSFAGFLGLVELCSFSLHLRSFSALAAGGAVGSFADGCRVVQWSFLVSSHLFQQAGMDSHKERPFNPANGPSFTSQSISPSTYLP